MSQPKEVHCPFCHHKEMQDGPVGSTVRCRNCKSIFRIPAEGMKHGEKVKKYKVYRHSPAYYVMVVLLLCGIVVGIYEVRQFFIERQKRLQEIWTKVEDPFAGKVQYPADNAAGVLERFMECWKQGKKRTPETMNYSGFECMLLYASADDMPDQSELQEVVAGFMKRFGDYQIQSYTLASQGTVDPKDPNVYDLNVNLVSQSAGGAVSQHGQLAATLVFANNEAVSRGKHIRENGMPKPGDPPIEVKASWGIYVRKSELTWD